MNTTTTRCAASLPNYGDGCHLGTGHDGPCLSATETKFYGSVAKAQAARGFNRS